MKLFVGNVSWNTDEQSLRSQFSEFGSISECKLITDRESGRSRGFGFVTFEDGADAKSAIQGMNGKQVDGRELKVSEATERAPRNDRW